MLISTKKKITEFPSKDQRVKDSEKKNYKSFFIIEMSLDNLPDMTRIC